MLNEPSITIAGRLTADPEMRYTANGTATAKFALVCNPRQMSGGQWTDGTPVFVPVICWRTLAENVCDSLRRGDPALVVGKFRQRNWETREGEKRTSYEIQADTVSVPLDMHTVKLTKTTRERAESEPSEPSGQAASEPSGQAASEPSGHAEPAAAGPGTDASASAGNGSAASTAASTAATAGKRRSRSGTRSAR